MICVDIDQLTPCLQDTATGDIVETEVIQIKRKSFLQKFNKKNGWYTQWAKQLDKNEVYALVIKGTVDIQGLVAVRNDLEMKAAYIEWMVAAPYNQAYPNKQKRYLGVGGHLFAIAADKSRFYGYECEMTGIAANADLAEYYVNEFGALRIGILHPLQIVFLKDAGRKLLEVYTYDWTEDEL